MSTSDFSAFIQLLQQKLENNSWQKLLLSSYQGEDTSLVRIEVRPVSLKEVAHLSFLYRHKTRDITKNFAVAEGLQQIQNLLGSEFKAAHFTSLDSETQLSVSKKGKVLSSTKAIKQAAGSATALTHDKEKQRFLTLDRPFLQQLGVTDSQQKLVPAMSRKWKQINKFVEVFDRALNQTGLKQKPAVHIADFGSGKAYLTFAVHDYLTHQLGLDAKVTGVELRQELVDLCNGVACDLNLQGIGFEQGDVKHFQAKGIDVMIALHACDIATDYAIHMGIRTGASMIMCSPCCHKQLRPQLISPPLLQPMLKHGIHLGEQAEMLTDSLRALLLEAYGYETQVFEFISLEHTSKNKMILAVKSQKPKSREQILAQVQQIKNFYGIQQHCLEELLLQSE
ncbi:class I SAM-dependent methyltransferase [Rheinheimera faecalis]